MEEEDRPSGPMIQLTDNGDGSSKITVSRQERDYRFNASIDGDVARLSYEETQTRGGIRVSEPPEEIWQIAATSDELTEWMDHLNAMRVTRNRTP